MQSSTENEHDVCEGNVISSASENSDNDSRGSSQKSSCLLTTRRGRCPRRSSALQCHTKHYVEHNYHDHFQDPIEPDLPPQLGSNQPASKKRKGHRGGVAIPFPEKLHFMLSRMENEGTDNIVNWQPHGRCFIVHKPKQFVEQVMPRFFRQTKLTSFQRQLNLYGFSRLTAGPDRGGYYHELFIRGRMDLCKRMVRTRVKGNGSKAASSPATEPNFYALPPCRDGVHVVHSDGINTFDDFNVMQTEDLPGIISVSDGVINTVQDSDIDEYPHEVSVSRLVPWHSDDSYLATPPSSPNPEKRRISIGSMCQNDGSNSTCPVVTPREPRALISPSGPQAISKMITFSELTLDSEAHSGDQIFFEGLPFHYLETKDIEDSLLVDDQ